MDQNQIKEFIAQKVPEGYSLSRIQDMLKEQGVPVTFMELRLLASEIETSVWTKTEKAEEPKPEVIPAKADAEELDPEEDIADDPYAAAPCPVAEPTADAADPVPEKEKMRGKTVVELSKIARPGAVAGGTVKFGSGVSAEWVLDQMGRLGLDKPTGKPDQQDIQEFQAELQKLFS